VNFFGHGCLAAEASPDAAFVFGAMLPDLAAMTGLRVARVAHAASDAGRRFHYATDAAFHRAARFRSLCLAATQALRGAGLRRGPARAIGHVGVELLLDGWLATERGVPALYREALALGPTLAPVVVFRAESGAEPLAELCGRIARTPFPPDAWREPERLATRLARILARRPSLALEPRELSAVRSWAGEARAGVAGAAPALLADVRAGLS
jgi:hypothetical protein